MSLLNQLWKNSWRFKKLFSYLSFYYLEENYKPGYSMHTKIGTFNLSNIFLDCQVLICDFHREQTWESWLNATKNGARMVKDIMLWKFQRIGKARTTEELQQALNDLRNCEYWKGGDVNMVTWFEKQWLPLIEVIQLKCYFKQSTVQLYFCFDGIKLCW